MHANERSEPVNDEYSVVVTTEVCGKCNRKELRVNNVEAFNLKLKLQYMILIMHIY